MLTSVEPEPPPPPPLPPFPVVASWHLGLGRTNGQCASARDFWREKESAPRPLTTPKRSASSSGQAAIPANGRRVTRFYRERVHELLQGTFLPDVHMCVRIFYLFFQDESVEMSLIKGISSEIKEYFTGGNGD